MNSKTNKKSGTRCEYHHNKDMHNIYRGDNSNQCWIDETREYDGKKYCHFHAPEKDYDKQPYNGIGSPGHGDYGYSPWGRAEEQSRTLKTLIDEWKENGSGTRFFIPKLRCGNMDFSDYTFKGIIDLTEAIFIGKVNFNNATFEDSAMFHKTTFGETADFNSVKFKSFANFTDASFSDAIFDKALFSNQVKFYKAKFTKEVTFYDTTFSCNTILNEEDYGMYEVSFRNTEFHKGASFNFAKFDCYTTFTDATFRDIAAFDHTEFKKNVEFNNNFNIGGDASFRSAEFNGKAVFNKATFKKEAVFERTMFKFGPDMSEIKFTRTPSFFDCDLSEGADFRGVIFKDTKSRGAPLRYRKLKQAMHKAQNKTEEAKFYGLEQKSLRQQPDTSLSYRFFSWLYEKTSNYGQSFMKPIYCLLFLVTFFTVVYKPFFLILNGQPEKITLFIKAGYPNLWTHLVQMFSFTITNIVSPFKIWTAKNNLGIDKYFDMASTNSAFAMKFLASFQSILCLTMITLFILALRRAFKLS